MNDSQKKNYRYLGDLLFLVPGLWVRELGPTGQGSSCRFWGSDENQPALLLDGRPLEDAWSGLSDLNLVPVEMIERIELYPSLNPFGLTPIGGIINIVTRNVPSNRPYTKIVYRSGKDDFSDLDVTFGQKLTPRWEILSGVLLKKFGKNIPDEKYSAQKIRAKITWRPSSDWEFQYAILHNAVDLDLPYTLPMPGDTLILTSPHIKNIRYDHTFHTAWKLWGIQSVFRVDHTSTSYEIREKNFNPKKTFPVKTTAFSLNQRLRAGNLPLSWGIQTQRRQLNTPDRSRHSDTITHTFLQGIVNLPSDLVSIWQVHSHISTDKKARFFGSGQIRWNFSSPLTLWTGYSEGVRDPSLGERFGYPFYPTVPANENQLDMKHLSTQILPNPDLKPEQSRTLEAGIGWQLEGRLQCTLRAYCRDTRNLIQGSLIQEGAQFTNQTKARFKGLETQIRVGPLFGFRADFVLNLLKATDEAGEDLLERPNLWGNGSLSWEHAFFQGDLHLNILIGTRYWSEFYSVTTENHEENPFYYHNPRLLFDFKTSFTFIQRAVFTFAIDNALDTDASLVYGFPLPRRTTRMGLSWELFD